MNERTYSVDFKNSLKKYTDTFYYKIPDMPLGQNSQLRFNLKKPFDGFIVNKSMFFAVEYKYVKDKTFPFAAIKPHQHEALSAVLAAGGEALIIIFFDIGRGEKYAVVMRYANYLVLKERLAYTRKSIPFNEFTGVSQIFKRGMDKELGKYLFNIEGIVLE